MRRLLSIVIVGIVAVAALTMTRCTSVTGGAPTGVKLAAATDSTVTVSWTAPSEGTADKYYVAFMATGASTYTNIDTVTTTSVVHDPAGMTGTYKVTAVFGSTTYDAATTPSSAPIHTAATSVSELNATGNAGYGWDRTAGTGATYSMAQVANAPDVDFYITDWATGFTGSSYYVYEAAGCTSDPGAVVTSGSWKNCGFSATVSEAGPLYPHVTGNYFNQQELTQYPFITGVYTTDGYFAMVKVTGLNSGAGTVTVESWFQPIKGLRLIQH